MRKEIIATMASDMNIEKFNNETDLQYTQRVLYSATACWVKAAALDYSNFENSKFPGATKKHIYEKTTHILSCMLERFPEIKPWFYVDESLEDPVRCVRRRLVQNGDLINSGFETAMTMSQKAEHCIADGIEQINGVFLDNNIFYSGVSSLHIKPNVEQKDTDPTAVEWFDSFCTTAWWEIGALENEDIEYFDCLKNEKSIHLCWRKNASDFLQNIRLARISINKNMYEYYIERQKNGIVYHHKIDPFLTELKEHRKMLFAMRKNANTPLPARITTYKDHAKLNLWVHLPYDIRVFLESYAWPSRNVSDVLEWKLPLVLVEKTKQKLVNLGMNVMEEKNG